MSENTTPTPEVPKESKKETWVCKSCLDTSESTDPSCGKCGLCLFCCDAWACDKCKKNFCGDISLKCAACNRCGDCCNCWVCANCTRKQPASRKACRTCNLCTSGGCCHCFQCNTCNNRYREMAGNGCRDCGRCNTCCACSGIDRYMPPNIQFHKSPPVKGFRRNPSERFLSMEVEISDTLNDRTTQIIDTVKKWGAAIVDDGSLPQSGCEINTAPANGDSFCNQIEELCASLKAQKAVINGQCGLHVHVDARDYAYSDLRRLLISYAKIEGALFDIVAPDRIKSKYCHPCGTELAQRLLVSGDPKQVKKQLLTNIYGVATPDKAFMQEIRQKKYNNARYNALNMHSWFLRSTIECRMHQGSLNATHIINWGILWAGILDYAMKNTDKFIIGMNGKPLDMLIEMAPTNDVKDWVLARSITMKKIKEQKATGKVQPRSAGYDLNGDFVTTPINEYVDFAGRRRTVDPQVELNPAFDYDAEIVENVTAPPTIQ